MDSDPAQGLLHGINQTFLESCDVYGLMSGEFVAASGQQMSSILPAYFVTNCSMERMKGYFQRFNVTGASQVLAIGTSGLDQTGNGDTFVALLFTMSGACASGWMLTFLLLLSPAHKRQPLVAQVATMFFAITMSVLLTKMTAQACEEYYADQLDMLKIRASVFNTPAYRVCVTVSQFLTQVAYVQMVLHLRLWRRRWTYMVAGVLMSARLGVAIYYEAACNNRHEIFHRHISSPYMATKVIRAVLMVAMVLCLMGTMLYYTIVVKNPTKLAYSRRLYPLAIVTLALFVLHVVLSLLSITYFRQKWLPLTWFVFLPYLIEVILITTLWEWIFNISIIEKRFELMGVLGRRISIDDAISLSSNKHRNRTYSIYNSGKSFFNRAFGAKHEVINDDEVSKLSSTTDIELSTLRNTEVRPSAVPSGESRGSRGSRATRTHAAPAVMAFGDSDDEAPSVGYSVHEEESDGDIVIDNYEFFGGNEESEDVPRAQGLARAEGRRKAVAEHVERANARADVHADVGGDHPPVGPTEPREGTSESENGGNGTGSSPGVQHPSQADSDPSHDTSHNPSHDPSDPNQSPRDTSRSSAHPSTHPDPTDPLQRDPYGQPHPDEAPPEFTPHPGFSRDDYWDEKMG
ncbi:hypothetical protein DICA4_F22298 [Diutina catenulata]